MSLTYIVLDYVCPSVGVVMAALTFSAPVSSVRRALEDGSLGNLNPTPWAFMTGNCVGWVAYSYLTSDLFVFFANAPGLMISIWLNMGAVQLQYLTNMSRGTGINASEHDIFVRLNDNEEEVEEGVEGGAEVAAADGTTSTSQLQRDRAKYEMRYRPSSSRQSTTNPKRAFSLIVLLWLIVFSIVGLVPMSRVEKADIVGIVGNINLGFFYGAPLSTIKSVVKNRDSVSIHRRTLVLNTVNSAFWTAYGGAIKDPFIFVPNAVGFALGLVQAVLCLCYPRGGSRGDDAAEVTLDREGTQPLNEELLL